MGLIEFFLPERLPRQVVFAGDHHAEIVNLRKGRMAVRARVEGAALAAGPGEGWERVMAGLHSEQTGLIFNSSPFIFNFFEFDMLPWKRKALRELVDWRLQKIFPEDTAAYEHRFHRLDKKRVLSILAPRSLTENAERVFGERRIPLTFIGCSTLEILSRAQAAKPAPDFFIESDGDGFTMLFQSRRLPIYIRKFRAGSAADAAGEIEKTVAFVRGQYSVEPRGYWLHEYDGGAPAGGTVIPGTAYSRLNAGMGPAPHIPGSR